MKLKTLNLAMITAISASALTLTGCGGDDLSNADLTSAISDARTFQSIEFTDTAAPNTAEKMATTYTESKAIVTYTDGSTEEFPLTYKKLFGTLDKVGTNANAAGQLYDMDMKPLKDPFDEPLIAETPDSNSLLKVGEKLFMVSHLEYDWLLSDGTKSYKAEGWYSRAPMSMILTEMEQDSKTGELSAIDQAPIDFSSVDGLWIPCFGSQTPWNTHLGSEEDYDLQFNPLNEDINRTNKGVTALNELYFNNTKVANPYHYGFFPEVTVNEDGTTSVQKHYSMGRGTWEAGKVMPDSRTVYYGDDGTNVALFMYVADAAEDLSAGTLYAGKFTQEGTSYSGDFNWIKLGHATDTEVKALADTTTFDDIFVNEAFDADAGTCPVDTKRVRSGDTFDECLAVKPGMEKAAAFLESRRYAALMGATTEFNKMEGIAVNDADKKLYMAISYLDKGMLDNDLPAEMEHIKMAKINAGVTFTLPMEAGQVDAEGDRIESDYVVTSMLAEDKLIGRDIETDALGNTSDPDFIANTDNIFFAEKMRTLFIGEDSGTHVNNFVWAYNVDTKKLSRILTNVAGAEATGLQAVENMDGFSYIMSNSQHHGDYIKTMNEETEAAIEATGLINKFDANFGYIGGMPAIK